MIAPESEAAAEVIPDESGTSPYIWGIRQSPPNIATVSASEPIVEASGAGAAAGGAAAAAAADQRPARQTYSATTPSGPNGENKTLYVGNLFFEVTEASLAEYFSTYGNIVKTRIVFDARGMSKGYV